MANRNITLSLPENELQRARVLAAHRGTSVSALLTQTLRDMVDREDGYTLARTRSLELLQSGADLGTAGRTSWSRDELHER